ncbi:MAG: biliverdin-producing heme oxygenase [bacterium]|nr:biliverdin-producing heme oxygenase [bacterium]
MSQSVQPDHAEGKPVAKCPFAKMAAVTPVPSLADALKERTKEAHARAEKHAIQSRMIKGEVSREQYAGWLGQMLHIWRVVDAGLAALSIRDARVAAMVKPYHAHAARVAADLAFLGHTESAHPPLPATARFVAQLNESMPGVGIVGAWYVLEGSANGGRYIAKAISRGLGIAGPEGLMNFDPHGEAQRPRWMAWRADLDAQVFGAAEREAMIETASATFDAVYDVMEDMERAG